MAIGGIVTIVLISLAALYYIWKVGIGKGGEEQGEGSLPKGFDKSAKANKRKLLREEIGFEEQLNKTEKNQYKLQENLDRAIQEMAQNKDRRELPSKESAQAAAITISAFQKEMNNEIAFAGAIEQSIHEEEKNARQVEDFIKNKEEENAGRITKDDVKKMLQLIFKKKDMIRYIQELLDKKEETLTSMNRILQGWTQKITDSNQAKIFNEVDDLNQLNALLKNIRVAQIKWHQTFTKQETEDEASN